MTSHQQISRETAYPAAMGYPRNQWYVAAFSRDVQLGTPLRRVLLDTPVLLYRTEAGNPVALYDRCPHRGAPLSIGKQVGDEIQCGYHGIRFGRDGRCTHVPSQPGTPAAMSVNSYPLVEKWQWIWIWLGDPAKADVDLIPDHDWLLLNNEKLISTPFFTIELGCNYQVFNDNLLDTSHLSYVHLGSLDGGGLALAKYKIKEEGGMISVRREEKGVSYEEPLASFLGCKVGVKYDRILDTETVMPSTHIAKQYMQPSDDPDAAPALMCAINALTPSTLHTTYMFHAMVANYSGPESPQTIEYVRHVIAEDVAVVDAIQKDFEQRGDMREVSVAADRAGILGRRMIQQLIDAEI